MAQKVYLISEAYIVDNSTIDANVEPSLYTNAIIEAQEIHLRPLLGTHLYDKIITDVAAGTITGVYKTLLDDYCQKVVCYWTIYESLPTIRFKIKNKGVVQQNSDNSVQPELIDFQYLTDKVKNKAEYYNQRVIDYLKTQGSNVFPELNQNNDYDDQQPQSTSYDTGIFLGDGTYDCTKYLGLNSHIKPLN